MTTPDRTAFDRLFEEYSSPIYNYVLRMVGDPDRAADVTQDTFIKAYRKLDSLTDEHSTKSWLYRIATNTAIDEMRRRKWVSPIGIDDPDQPERPDTGPGPEAQVMAGMLDDRIQRAHDAAAAEPPTVPDPVGPGGHERAADRRGDGPLLWRGAHPPMPRAG